MAWLNDIFVGALSSGVNANTLVLLNTVLGLTFGCIFFLLWTAVSKNPALLPHVAVLIVLAIGLTASINWFVYNIGLVDPQQQNKELFGTGDKKEDGDSSAQPAPGKEVGSDDDSEPQGKKAARQRRRA